MPSLKEVYRLPVGTSRIQDAEYWNDILYYDFVRAGARTCGRIRFEWVPAYRFRAERCMLDWHHDAEHVLVEVEDSEWLREILADTDSHTHDHGAMHHDVVSLESIGTWQIIAASLQALPDLGSFPRMSPK